MTSAKSHLIHSIVCDFASRFVRSPDFFICRRKADRERLLALGVPPFEMLRAPDVVIHDRERDWLFLFDDANKRRHMNEGRRAELNAHFAPADKHLIFFSAFPDSTAYCRCATSIAWETEVWIADEPDHMIHYNGRKFLGPYPKERQK